MVKLSKIKEVGVADSMEEAMAYKNYLKNELGYNVDNISVNVIPGSSGSKDKIEFTLSYKVDTKIDPLNQG